LWVVLVGIAVAYVLRYTHRVKADPARSIVGISVSDRAEAAELVDHVPQLTSRDKLVLVLFFGAFAVMIYGFVPWDEVMDNMFGTSWPLPTFSSFYFAEAAMLFIVMAVVIGLIARLGEEGTVDTIVAGGGDFLGAALIIVLARGITVVMKNAAITDTILSWTEDGVQGTSAGAFAIVVLLVNLPIAFRVPSSSGHAALVMPILAPLADFANVDRAVVVTADQSASGLVNLITPTAAVVLGGLTLAKVRYDQYLRFALPFVGIVFVVTTVFLAAGTALS
ncbi:MAG: Na+/H+ antiporter NhaC family protein, partial [Acidimicrobiales bacterium]